MEPVDCSRPADQPQQNFCHQTRSWSAVQHMSVYQPIADVKLLLSPTDSHRKGTSVWDRVEPCTREWPAWIPHGVKQAASEVLHFVTSRSRLRSADTTDFIVPRTRTKFGERAFCVSGPTTCNSLPESLRSITCTATFKRHLKTHFLTFFYPSH